MASSSPPTSNPDSLALSEPIDPWSHPIDDNDPEDLIVANGGNTDAPPPQSDKPQPLPSETPPFASSVPKVHVDQTVLDEFDPQGNKVEQEAKKAWEQSEPHPPVVPPKSPPTQSDPVTQDEPTTLPTNVQSLPPPAPIPVPAPVPVPSVTDKPLPDPDSTTQDPPQPISRSTTPSLSGLAAIARTFIPRSPVRTSRPLSIDQATMIASPTTATFGVTTHGQGSSHKRSQSQGPAPSSSDHDSHSKSDENRSQTPGSAPRTPKSAAKDVDKDQPPPFDFQFFLEQMKSKPAEHVAKYLRSCVPAIVTTRPDRLTIVCRFLTNFAKRTFTVNDQMKLIHDFLNVRSKSHTLKIPSNADIPQFIVQKMHECEVWKTATETEFDNALEGMEKLVMNRLYD